MVHTASSTPATLGRGESDRTTPRPRPGRRRAIIALSRRGEQLPADLDRALLHVDDEILGPLTRAERATLNALLSKAIRHIASACAPPSDVSR